MTVCWYRCFVLLTALLSGLPAQATEQRQTMLLIMIDGFRADRVEAQWAPRLEKLAQSGVRSAMVPVWPALSMPNHWALVTGLNGRSSGLWHNDMLNPVTRKPFTAADPNYAYGEPIWTTLRRDGRISAVIGSWLVMFAGERGPTYHIPMNAPQSAAEQDMRASVALDLLSQPSSTRPQLVGLYYYDVDIAQHQHGVESKQARAAIAHVDAEIGRLIDGLAASGLGNSVNVLVVADHGHLDVTGRIVVSDLIDSQDLIHPALGGGPVFSLWPKPGLEDAMYRKLKTAHPHVRAYRGNEIPAEFGCCRSDRTPPILLVSDDGWTMHASKDEYAFQLKGSHAFRLDNPTMHAAFVAAGPAIRKHGALQRFDTVDLYSLLAELLQVPPQHSDGSIRPFCNILIQRPATCEL